jgi:hypothetical protein
LNLSSDERAGLGIASGASHSVWSVLRGRSSVVERQLPKLNVVGSIPIARSIFEKT